MPLKPLPYRDVKRKLEAAGFEEVTQKGSHVKFAKSTDEGTRTAIAQSADAKGVSYLAIGKSLLVHSEVFYDKLG